MRADARANRDRILVAAADVFGANGVDASTEEVARRAGVGIATVFRHFATKDELVAAAVQQHVDQLLAKAQQLARDGDASHALSALVEAMVEPGARVALAGTSGESIEQARAVVRPVRLALGRALRRAQSAGAARSDVAVDQLFLAVQGIAVAAASAGVRRATVRGAAALVVAGVR